MDLTVYLLRLKPDTGPRCRNTHTLAPLFSLRDPITDEWITDPVPLAKVPEEHFWQNSEGYGFDLRNLAVLLRTNFRNLNPHAPDRHLWCNERDLSSLFYRLPSSIKNRVFDRMLVLNQLSTETRRRLADMASELYSFSYQKFFDWVCNFPASLWEGLNMETSQQTLVQQIIDLVAERRAAAIQGIQQHTGVQANQHLAEPAGIRRESDLYRLLEIYKATVIQEFLAYTDVKNKELSNVIRTNDDQIEEYMQIQFLGLCARYVMVLKKKPRHLPRMLLWHWVFRITTQATAGIRRRGITRAVRLPAAPFLRHIRVYFDLTKDVYCVSLEDEPADEAYESTCNDAGNLWHLLQTQLGTRGATLHMASLAGGLYEMCTGARWQTTLHRDNRLIHTLAKLVTLPRAPMASLNDLIINDSSRVMTLGICIDRIFGNENSIATGVLRLLRAFIITATNGLYDVSNLNNIVLRGGYDDGPSTLLNKLRGAMNGVTCVQDVASELCEFLSAPYPPEQTHFAAFQVDHTNIPPLLITTT